MPLSENFENIDTLLFNKLDKSGGIVSGDLILTKDPLIDNHAVNKKYVDEQIKNSSSGSGLPEGGTEGQSIVKEADGANWGYVSQIQENSNQKITLFNIDQNLLKEQSNFVIEFTPDEGEGTELIDADQIAYNDSITTLSAANVQKAIEKLNEKLLASGGGEIGDYITKAGGTLTGSLILKGDPTENLEAATKQYVDNHGGQSQADKITYNNTTSQLKAIEVQSAIDEVVTNLKNYVNQLEGVNSAIQAVAKTAGEAQTVANNTASNALPKTGGTITGNLNIIGDLTQNGNPIGTSDKIVYGTYVGNNNSYISGGQIINLGFSPVFVIVGLLDRGTRGTSSSRFITYYYEDKDTAEDSLNIYGEVYLGYAGTNYTFYSQNNDGDIEFPLDTVEVLKIIDNGFVVNNSESVESNAGGSFSSGKESIDIMLNKSDKQYWYIAVKGE